MDVLLGSVKDYTFDLEILVEDQTGAQLLPFSGMDKSTAAVCTFHNLGLCTKGANCPFRHVRGDRTIVCKHWLRGLCKKGDQCEFLHEYDMSKMPECYFYTKFNACHNKECDFLHINPDDKRQDCPWYDRGFCRHGPACRNRHVRRVLCMNYFAGFCPEGPECKQGKHPRFELPQFSDLPQPPRNRNGLVCHYCGEVGHKATSCFKVFPEKKEEKGLQYMNSSRPNVQLKHYSGTGTHTPGEKTRLENITCYKCGQQGHFANYCSKGHFAFLNTPTGPPPPKYGATATTVTPTK